MIKQIDIVRSDDWDQVYVNGYISIGEHNITMKQLTDLMREQNITIVNYHTLTEDGSKQYEEYSFPKYFENIKPEFIK